MDAVAVDEALTEALIDALGYLTRLQRDGVRPGPARAGLDRLRERHPGTGMDLVWEEEPYGATVHYDALLHGDGGTVSLSYCPDRAVPWPLRGVQRWTDRELVRVNTTAMRVDQAIACLDFIWDDRRIIDRLVNACLIQEALAREPIELSDEELQQAMDGFRRARRLYTAEETRRWMARRGMTHEQLEEYVGDTALVARLRRAARPAWRWCCATGAAPPASPICADSATPGGTASAPTPWRRSRGAKDCGSGRSPSSRTRSPACRCRPSPIGASTTSWW